MDSESSTVLCAGSLLVPWQEVALGPFIKKNVWLNVCTSGWDIGYYSLQKTACQKKWCCSCWLRDNRTQGYFSDSWDIVVSLVAEVAPEVSYILNTNTCMVLTVALMAAIPRSTGTNLMLILAVKILSSKVLICFAASYCLAIHRGVGNAQVWWDDVLDCPVALLVALPVPACKVVFGWLRWPVFKYSHFLVNGLLQFSKVLFISVIFSFYILPCCRW